MKKKGQRLVKEQSLEWLQHRENSVAKSSISSYQRMVYKHIIPNIGENKVDKE